LVHLFSESQVKPSGDEWEELVEDRLDYGARYQSG